MEHEHEWEYEPGEPGDWDNPPVPEGVFCVHCGLERDWEEAQEEQEDLAYSAAETRFDALHEAVS